MLGDSTNTESISPSTSTLPELSDAEALGNDLKRILVRSEGALLHGDAKANVEQLERWIESYRRGLTAAHKISVNGIEMLNKTRDQLKLSLDELLRLEDEGGNPPTRDRAGDSEEIASAIRRIERLIPTVEESFKSTQVEELVSD